LTAVVQPPCAFAHLGCCADGRARREQLLRHRQVTAVRSQVQRRVSVLPGARAVSAPAPTAPRAPAPGNSRAKLEPTTQPLPYTAVVKYPSAPLPPGSRTLSEAPTAASAASSFSATSK